VKNFRNLGDAIAHFVTMQADIKLAEEAAVAMAMKIVQRTAKRMIGKSGNPFWPELAQSTIEDKIRHGWPVPSPLLRTGELRDSIETAGPFRSGNTVRGYVGSNNDKAVWHELGTSRVPPRPFLSLAAMGKEKEIVEKTAAIIFATMVRGGPNFRGLREAMRLARELYRAGKDFVDDMDDDNEKER
jgi:phage gpG-like protein